MKHFADFEPSPTHQQINKSPPPKTFGMDESFYLLAGVNEGKHREGNSSSERVLRDNGVRKSRSALQSSA